MHRIAGRADERAVAHGGARAQAREDLARRRRGDQRPRDPGQRVERLARDRLAAPSGRRSRARPHVAGARVGPRLAGRAEVPAQPAQARVVRARARRVPASGASRAAGATSAWPRIASSSAKTATSSRSRPKARTASGARCRPATCTSTASSATSATACCATARRSPKRDVVVVIVTVDTQAGEVVTGPEIVTRGWVWTGGRGSHPRTASRRCARRSPRARRGRLRPRHLFGATADRSASSSTSGPAGARSSRRDGSLSAVRRGDRDHSGRRARDGWRQRRRDRDLRGARARRCVRVGERHLRRPRRRRAPDLGGDEHARPVKADVTSPLKITRMRGRRARSTSS